MLKPLQSFLDGHKIHYETTRLNPQWNTQRIAQTMHVPEKGIAKTVLVKIDGKLAMLVEPTTVQTNLERWKEHIGCNEITLATDGEIREMFKESDKTAIPAFGNLFNLDVYLDETLGVGKEIALNTGTRSELIKLNYRDFVKWVKPKLFHIH